MSKAVLNPRTKTYEFYGVPGTLAITIGLPALTVLLNQLIRTDYHIEGFFRNFQWEEVWNQLKPFSYYIYNRQLWTYYSAWFITLALLDLPLPGRKVKGVTLRDGTQLTYLLNGISMSVSLVLVLCVRWSITSGEMPELQFLYEHHTDICIIAILASFVISILTFAFSYVPLVHPNGHGTRERILSLGGNTKSMFYNWFIGRELNPRLGPLDIKLFCELRPGMMLWLLINLSCLHHYYLRTGEINDALLLVNILQGFYIFDGVLNEEGVLTMMDIVTDGFGFMLAFGDLALVPFTYSLQARYLSVSPITLGPYRCAAIVAVMALGYWIFHSSNKEKSYFRMGRLPHLKSIQTDRGTKLLCDSWWAMSQHINYFGDWLISLSFCLCTGFQTPLSYYYVMYFAILLLHRQMRDEHKCAQKYGKYWDEYKSKVPYKIIPYVY
ncbi:HGL231Wp [Eremothecium sinecaudum]|uniref:Delta(14)-sterol reductase n=1 Tax=Eremothecium sinecaudum TaxID=45286 RepID=A0A0X8HV65_9SACH|nr:HGL231Wp [Eremothecium sinecaudum]AMD22109.1 HGL231Wp [Eremothecium sinecaudum]